MLDTFRRVTEFDERRLLQCDRCKRETIHTLEAKCTGDWSSTDDRVSGGSDFHLFRCGACDNVCFVKETWCTEDLDVDENGEIYNPRYSKQYPIPAAPEFSFDTNFIPHELNELIEELLYAMTGGKLKISTAALRMIIEFIVKDKNCVGRNLINKINSLKDQGYISDDQRDLLHKIRIKGNSGVHDQNQMTKREMIAGIGVINLLLEKLYNSPAREADIMRKATQAFGNATQSGDAPSDFT